MKNAAECVSLTDSLGDSSNTWHVSDKISVWENYETFDIIFGITLFSDNFNLNASPWQKVRYM